MPKTPAPETTRFLFAGYLAKVALFCVDRLIPYATTTKGHTTPAARRLRRAAKELREAAGMLGFEESAPGEFWSPRWMTCYTANHGNRLFQKAVSWGGQCFHTTAEVYGDYQRETAAMQIALDKSEVGTLLLAGEEDEA